MGKKMTIYLLMCYGSFAGMSTAVANVLAINVQAKTWDVTPEQAAYSVRQVAHDLYRVTDNPDFCCIGRHHRWTCPSGPSGSGLRSHVLLLLERSCSSCDLDLVRA